MCRPRPIICYRMKSNSDKLNETPNVLLHWLNHIIEDTQLEYLLFLCRFIIFMAAALACENKM